MRLLDPGEVSRLEAEPFTYSLGDPRLVHLERTEVVGRGRAEYASAVEKLMTWRMHSGSGLRVAASSVRVAPGAVVVCRLGPGPLSVRIPCRVVSVLDEFGRAGFTYGTLPGHPESGQESFVVALTAEDVTLTVTADSRHASLLTRLGGPVSTAMQARAIRRYAAALRD